MDGVPVNTGGLRAIADRAFEAYSPYPGLGFLHHNLRVYELSRLVMESDGLELDDDLLYEDEDELRDIADRIEGTLVGLMRWSSAVSEYSDSVRCMTNNGSLVCV